MRPIAISIVTLLVACNQLEDTAGGDVRKSCGNGVCQSGETCGSCPQDCGACDVDAGVPDAPVSTAVGPQASITCPAGAVQIAPGQDIPSIVAASASGTTFCILAGTHHPTAPINPKSYDVLVGQYGAIIDGSAVTMAYDVDSTSIIRGWNCTGCDHVTVRNLVVENLAAHNCIGMFNGGDNWIVDHNETKGCKTGISTNTGSRVTYNYSHHNYTYAMGGYMGVNELIDHNELAFSGGTPDNGGSSACTKWTGGQNGLANLTITNNYVHDCNTTGLWLDGADAGSEIAYNRIENNTRGGIEWEVSLGGTVHDNTIAGNQVAIFISSSQGVEAYNNTITQANGFALQLFVDASRLDLSNNYVHDNHVDLAAHPVSPVAGLSCINTTSCAGYGTPKNNRFDRNAYNTGGRTGSAFWYWGAGSLTWTQWRAIPEDVNGSVQ